MMKPIMTQSPLHHLTQLRPSPPASRNPIMTQSPLHYLTQSLPNPPTLYNSMDTQSSDASNRNYVSQWWSNPPTLCNTMMIQFSGIMEPNDDLIRWYYAMMTQSLDINVTHWWTHPSVLWQPMMTNSSSLCNPMLIESYETTRTNGEPDIIQPMMTLCWPSLELETYIETYFVYCL